MFQGNNKERNNVVRLPGIKPEAAAEQVAFMHQIAYEGLMEVRGAKTTPDPVQLPSQVISEHLTKGPYYDDQQAA